MELNIVLKEKNPFLQREELKFEVKKTTKTPTRREIREKLLALTNAKDDALIVNSINHKFGSHAVFGTAKIYDSKDAMEKTEQKYVIARNFGKKDKKEAIKPKETEQPEQKKEEKPVEDKKEEQGKEKKEKKPVTGQKEESSKKESTTA